MWEKITWTESEQNYFTNFRSWSNEADVLARAVDRLLLEARFTDIRLLDFGGGDGDLQSKLKTTRAMTVTIESDDHLPTDPSGQNDGAARTPDLGELRSFNVFLFCRVLGYLPDPLDVLKRLTEVAAERALWIAIVSAPSGDQYEFCRLAASAGLTSRPPERTSSLHETLRSASITFETRTIKTRCRVADETQARRVLAFFLGRPEGCDRVAALAELAWSTNPPSTISSHHTMFWWTTEYSARRKGEG